MQIFILYFIFLSYILYFKRFPLKWKNQKKHNYLKHVSTTIVRNKQKADKEQPRIEITFKAKLFSDPSSSPIISIKIAKLQ